MKLKAIYKPLIFKHPSLIKKLNDNVIMKNKQILEKNHLPVTDMIQLQSVLAEFILWYDTEYCKGIEGANEVVGDYFSRKTINNND